MATPIRDHGPHANKASAAQRLRRGRDALLRHASLLGRHAASVLLALIVLFEQWGWEPLSRWTGALARLPGWARLERHIAALPPHGALAVLMLPWVILLPAKLLTLWLLATGQLTLALVTIVLCKLAGTAVVARLFTLTRPALLRWAWFAARYAAWLRFKLRLLAQARATPTWARLLRLRARCRTLASAWR